MSSNSYKALSPWSYALTSLNVVFQWHLRPDAAAGEASSFSGPVGLGAQVNRLGSL